jgi:hypothetical protein
MKVKEVVKEVLVLPCDDQSVACRYQDWETVTGGQPEAEQGTWQPQIQSQGHPAGSLQTESSG